MKKIILFYGFLLFCTALLAQSEIENNIRAGKNNFLIEVNFQPFNEEANVIGIDRINMKYGLTDKIFLRLGLNFNYKNNQTDKQNFVMRTMDQKYTQWGVMPGIEFHFIKQSKVSPYVGFDLMLTNKTSKAELFYDKKIINIENAWEDWENRAFNSCGIGVPIGANFYFMKNFYCGVEFNFAFNRIKYKAVNYQDTQVLEPMVSKDFALKYDNAIRIGFYF